MCCPFPLPLFICCSPFSGLVFFLTRYCCPVPPHPRLSVALQVLSEIYPSSLVISFNAFLLLLKLKDILHVARSHESIMKDHKPDVVDWGQLLLE